MEQFSDSNVVVYRINEIIEKAGNGHTYQRRALYVFGLQWLIGSFFVMGYPFLFLEPPLVCKDPANPSQTFPCNATLACSGEYNYTFAEEGVDSLVKEFNLVCNQSWLRLAMASVFVGGALGSFYSADLSERKGRFHSIMFAIVSVVFFGAISIFSWNIVMFAICSLLIDFSLRGFMNNSLVYMTELSSENIRTLTPSLLNMCFAIGQMIFPILVYYFSGWRTIMSLVFTLPIIITFLFYRTMNESPRFLNIKEQWQETREAILNMARINNRSIPPFALFDELDKAATQERLAERNMQDDQLNVKLNYSMLTLFKYNSLKMTTLALIYMHLVISAIYYVLWYSSDPLYPDIHTNFFISGAIELFGYLISAFLALNQRRKITIKGSFVATGICIILSWFFNTASTNTISFGNQYAVIIFIAGKVFACVATNTLLIYVLEFYPTRVRHFAIGFFAVITRFILVLVPALIQTSSDLAVSPLLLLGGLSIGSFFLVTYCPETYEKPLQDHITEEKDRLLGRELDEY